MFTGIVQSVGMVALIKQNASDVTLMIEAPDLGLADAMVGDSISVAGACLTVTHLQGKCFSADVSNETLACTTLGQLLEGSPVNLEKALCAGQALGGHYVTGHVDGLGVLRSTQDDGRSTRLVFELPHALSRYVAPKGSITIEGVSLTVNEVAGDRFGVNVIPHTQSVTTLGALQVGDQVNVEIDIIARYVERLISAQS
jgi:riboflavin synthase